jgi:D-beta-D-heptose 7-phosphate kinase/D-beta-D-heptose 1-phosphate adenosyltransferase
VRRLRRRGTRIAFTNGCFDLLHIGHLKVFEMLKSQADCLIVGVNSDSSVRRLKGSSHPIVPAHERAALVASLKGVDYVTIFSEPTPLRLIREIQPDLLAKGGDWKRERIVGADFVQSRGGKVLVVPTVKGHSTTRLLHHIQNLKKVKDPR